MKRVRFAAVASFICTAAWLSVLSILVSCRNARDPEVARALLQQGAASFSASNYNQSIELAESIIEDDPKNPDAYYLRGRALYLRYLQAYYKHDPKLDGSDLTQAMSDFTKVIELKRDFAEAYDFRGMILTAQSRYDAALKDFNTALQLQPRHAETYYGRAELYERQGRYAEAIADYRRFIEISRDQYWRNKARRKIRELKQAISASK
jgi:tetratricopeptide (TPR) repeat protein